MKFNDSFIPQLARSREAESLVVGIAEDHADIVRATAPVDTAEYVNNVRVEVIRTPYRVVAKTVVDVEHALLVEGKHGTLRRALRRVL